MTIPMNSTTIIATIGGILLLAILLFTVFKGVMRMLTLAIGLALAVGAWIFFYKNGFTFVSFITDSPQPWMVHVLAGGVALLIIAITIHGLTWISQVLSFNRRVGPTGITTTILMCLLALWLGVLGISYYGDVCRIAYYHDLAEAQMTGAPQPSLPFFTQMKVSIRTNSLTAWLEKINPMENPARTNLACLIAYGCTLDAPHCDALYHNQLANRGIPHPYRLLDLFRDPGMRKLVQEKRYVPLLENERLNTFLQFDNTEEFIRNIL